MGNRASGRLPVAPMSRWHKDPSRVCPFLFGKVLFLDPGLIVVFSGIGYGR